MTYPSAPVMGYSVYSGSLDEIRFDERLTVINTLNAYSFVTAEKDAVFKKALQSSDILIADGFPIVIAARLLGGYKIRKIAGADMFHYVLYYLQVTSGSCFFLGSSLQTLERIKKRIVTEYPKIQVSFYSPPFKDQYSDQDTHVMLNAINKANPFAVFVGMSAPKQEKWVYQNCDSIHANVICSIGAVFDFYAETIKRPSKIWVRSNLEWFIRLIREPKRLYKRYLIYSPKFFVYMLAYLLRFKGFHPE